MAAPSPRVPVIAGNWKMFKTRAETREFFAAFLPLVAGASHCRIVVAPPFTALAAAVESARGSAVASAAQNLHWEPQGAFSALTPADFSPILVAYEPVWAIGTGRTATPELADEAHCFLRSLAARRFGDDAASRLRILYGGSVKPENIRGLMAMDSIDGALVGGASLEPRSFAAIVNYKEA